MSKSKDKTKATDTGYGSGPGRGHARVLRPDGTLNVKRTGGKFRASDLYRIALNTTWTKFILSAMVVFMSVNVLFALIYLLIGVDGIHGSEVHTETTLDRFADAFFFSSHTLTTVGYGSLAPGSGPVSFVSAFEAMFGLLMFGIFTGLSFGRISRIKPRIEFSDDALIAPYKDGLNALMFRLVNQRDGQVMNAKTSVLLVVEYHDEGRLKREFHDLPLEIAHIKSFALSWTVVHPIDEDSPLLKLNTEDLSEVNAEVIVIMEAFDDSVGQNFYARKSYTAKELKMGRKFVPMFHSAEDDYVLIDLKLLGKHKEAELFPAEYVDEAD